MRTVQGSDEANMAWVTTPLLARSCKTIHTASASELVHTTGLQGRYPRTLALRLQRNHAPLIAEILKPSVCKPRKQPLQRSVGLRRHAGMARGQEEDAGRCVFMQALAPAMHIGICPSGALAV